MNDRRKAKISICFLSHTLCVFLTCTRSHTHTHTHTTYICAHINTTQEQPEFIMEIKKICTCLGKHLLEHQSLTSPTIFIIQIFQHSSSFYISPPAAHRYVCSSNSMRNALNHPSQKSGAYDLHSTSHSHLRTKTPTHT